VNAVARIAEIKRLPRPLMILNIPPLIFPFLMLDVRRSDCAHSCLFCRTKLSSLLLSVLFCPRFPVVVPSAVLVY
jgi:hypothetical protein